MPEIAPHAAGAMARRTIPKVPWKSIGIRAHFRYKPTWLDDEDAGDFCDPFGFCQGSLQQVETAAAVVVRF